MKLKRKYPVKFRKMLSILLTVIMVMPAAITNVNMVAAATTSNLGSTTTTTEAALVLTEDNVDRYCYGWNGSGVDFSAGEVNGLFDGNTTLGSAKSDGTFNNTDTYLVLDLKSKKNIDGMQIDLKEGFDKLGIKNDGTAASWAVYGSANDTMSSSSQDWTVLFTSQDITVTDGSITAPFTAGEYRYIMIGASEFPNSWVHSWDQFSEITIYTPVLPIALKDSDVTTYNYGWSGSGVEFFEKPVNEIFNGETSTGFTYSDGTAASSDAYLVIDLKSKYNIEGLQIALKDGYDRLGVKNDGTSATWAIYGSASDTLSTDSADWTELLTSANIATVSGNSITTVTGSSITTATADSISASFAAEEYRYIMIGCNTEFLNSWVHSWDQFSEISFYTPVTSLTLTDSSNSRSIYGWSGSGVEFYTGDVNGLFDGNTSNGLKMTDGSDVSSDAYLAINLNNATTVNGIQIALKDGYDKLGVKNDNTSATWAVYGSSMDTLSDNSADWTVLFTSDAVNTVSGSSITTVAGGSIATDITTVTGSSITAAFIPGEYHYIMIGGNGFPDSWVHSWDQFSEITVYSDAIAETTPDDGDTEDESMKDWTGWSEVAKWNELVYSTTTAELTAGETTDIDYTLPSDTSLSVTYTTDNMKVATVNSSGVITAVAAGTARVTATFSYIGDSSVEYGSYLTKVTVKTSDSSTPSVTPSVTPVVTPINSSPVVITITPTVAPTATP